MINPNTGKRPQIPLNTSGHQTDPAAEKIKNQALAVAQDAKFPIPSPLQAPSTPSPIQERRRGRKKGTEPRTILKGIYFDPIVYDALMEMQDKGQNVSKYVNRVIKQHLGL